METKNENGLIGVGLIAALALLAALWLADAKKTDALDNLKAKLIAAGVISPEQTDDRLSFLWTLGLANKNEILEIGPMADPRYDKSRFASTGGWKPAQGGAMDHYSRHEFIELTDAQQKLVEKMAKNIYRPCCDNPTHFPDCNHGMAMLGLLELMASEGASEEKIYRAALEANSEWFPDAYRNIAKYFAAKGLTLAEVGAKEILSAKYSSASGYQNVLLALAYPESGSGVAC